MCRCVDLSLTLLLLEHVWHVFLYLYLSLNQDRKDTLTCHTYLNFGMLMECIHAHPYNK